MLEQKDKTKAWYAIFFIILLVLLLRYVPKIGYGLAAVTLLVILMRMRQK